MPTTIVSQNFDGVTAPALPASGFSSSGAWATNASVSVSSPNCLLSSTTPAVAVYESDTADSNDGDTQVSAWIRVSASAPDVGRVGLLYLRSAGSTTFGSSTHYEARISLTSTTGPTYQVQLDRRNAGTGTTLGTDLTIPSFTGSAFLKLRLVAETNGSQVDLNVYLQRATDNNYLTAAGAWQSGEAACITAADTSGSRITGTGKAGMVVSQPVSHSVVQFDDFLFEELDPDATISIDTPIVNQIIQRTGTTTGGGTASIDIDGTYTGTPTSIEARFNGGTWTEIDASPAAGAFSGTLASQAAGQGAVEVRFSNATGITDSVADVGIGEVFAVFGQSNAVCLATNPQSWSAPASYSHFKPGAVKLNGDWAILADHPFDTTEESAAVGKGSCYPRLATQLMEQLEVPVGFICVGKGSTGLIGGSESPKLNHWDKDGTGANAAEQYDKAVSTINGATLNGVRAILWAQGEADTLGSGAGDNAGRSAYAAAVSQLLDDLQADCAALASAKMIVYTLAEYVRTDTSASDLTTIRMAQVDAVDADADLFLGPVGYDQNFTDDGHWASDTQIARLADLWYCSISTALFSGTEGYAPALSSAVKTAAGEITLTFDRDLDTSVMTYDEEPFTVIDQSGTMTVSTAERTAARTVVLTMSASIDGDSTVSLGRGNASAGLIVPQSAAVTLPNAATVKITAQPFELEAVASGFNPAWARNINILIGV